MLALLPKVIWSSCRASTAHSIVSVPGDAWSTTPGAQFAVARLFKFDGVAPLTTFFRRPKKAFSAYFSFFLVTFPFLCLLKNSRVPHTEVSTSNSEVSFPRAPQIMSLVQYRIFLI